MLITFFRSIVLYIIVLVVMRLMGKREISQMQPFELAISIMIADLASIPMTEIGIPIFNGIVPILGLLLMHLVISVINIKSITLRKFICGKPSILIYRGKIDEKVLKKVNRNSSIETIVKRVDKEKTDQLRVWMEENNLYTGINIDEDTKRYYPYSTLASHIIGFVGSDNQGLDGIEAKYDKVLTGENGSISKMLDAKGNIIGDSGEEYEKATQGNDIILTIDMNIQAIAEKYLQQACIENVCTDGGNVILMNPQNGDILAMATYPFYDLNDPYTINNDEIKDIWSELDSSQKNTYLQGMWRNKAIADTYEPRFNF